MPLAQTASRDRRDPSTALPMNLLDFQSRSESRAQGAAKSTSPSSRRAQRHFPPPRLLEKWRCARLGSANWSSPLLGLSALQGALDSIAVTTDAGRLYRVWAALTLVLAAPEYIVQK